ncbi:hypothetical protein LguiA_005037 [Lonicera macranthoides]
MAESSIFNWRFGGKKVGPTTSLQQEMSLIEERTLLPSSPSPLYNSSHTKSSSSTFMKGGGGGTWEIDREE